MLGNVTIVPSTTMGYMSCLLQLRLRSFLGLNNAISDLIRSFEEIGDAPTCTFEQDFFEVPKPQNLTNPDLDDVLSALTDAIAEATNDTEFAGSTSIGLQELIDSALLEDTYEGSRGGLSGQPLSFGVNFLLFSEDIKLFGIPDITIEPIVLYSPARVTMLLS